MPHVFTNGIRLSYEYSGHGEPVLMIMGQAASGKVWSLYQTPALTRAGYRTITFDSRGIPPSDAPGGKYSLADMVADARGLIEALGVGPCRIVGVSLGAMIAQELAIYAPQLVRCAVLMATKSRSDTARSTIDKADIAMAESGIKLPAAYNAAVMAFRMLSPATLNNDAAASLWLETFQQSAGKQSDNGQAWIDTGQDSRASLTAITAPCRVIAFADDLITPPHLAAEVADAIPDCDFVEIPACGHLGYLERPDEVNTAIIEFLNKN